MDNLLLSIVTFAPALAAVILLIFCPRRRRSGCASGKTLCAFLPPEQPFLISLLILAQFNPADPGFQMVEEAEWLLGLQYKMGVDRISILFRHADHVL